MKPPSFHCFSGEESVCLDLSEWSYFKEDVLYNPCSSDWPIAVIGLKTSKP